MFISSSSDPRVGLLLIPPTIAQVVLDSAIPLDSLSNLEQLSGILSDADVSYYLWYNSKAKELLPELAGDLVSLYNEPSFQQWIDTHQTIYNKVAAESDAKYSIAGGGSRRSLAVDYGSGCFYTPTCSSGILFMLGSAEDPYSGQKNHYYDAVLAELAKVIKIADITAFTVFDKYVGAPLMVEPE